MKQIKMTCDICSKEELFFVNSGLYGWNTAKLQAGPCWYEFTICSTCWGEGRDMFSKTLWRKFLNAIGVK